MCCTCISSCLASSLHLTIGAPLLPQGTSDPAAEEQALGGRGGFSSLSGLQQLRNCSQVGPSLPRPRNAWFLAQRPTSPAQPGSGVVAAGGRGPCQPTRGWAPLLPQALRWRLCCRRLAPLLPRADEFWSVVRLGGEELPLPASQQTNKQANKHI